MGDKKVKSNFGESFKSRVNGSKDNLDKAARSTVNVLKKSAKSVAAGSGKVKTKLDANIRTALDNAFESKKQIGLDNLQRLRTANPTASPAVILTLLDSELDQIDDKKTGDEAVVSATTLYVMTALAVYGDRVKDAASRQRLIDATTLLDSPTAKTVAALGGMAVTLLASRFGVIGKVVKGAAKAGAGMAVLAPILSVAGISNPGKKGAAFVIKAATKKALGTPPKTWPVEKTKTTKSK